METKPSDVQLIIEPISKRLTIKSGITVYQALRDYNISINSPCGGKGTCGQCKIRVSLNESAVNSPNSVEKSFFTPQELMEGHRLACCTQVMGNTRVFLSDSFMNTGTKILTESSGKVLFKYPLRPTFWKISFNVQRLREYDHVISDLDRLKEAIFSELPLLGIFNRTIDITYSCLQKIPRILREEKGEVTIILRTDIGKVNVPVTILNVQSGDTSAHLYGIAFDIGTTTIVGYLLNLKKGKVLAVDSLLNPQTAIGEDVITRLEYASKSEENANYTQKLVFSAITQIIDNLISEVNGHHRDIAEISVVGNTAMHHLLFALPVKYLGRAPYSPVIRESMAFRNYNLNIEGLSSNSEIYSPPVIAGFVGADTIADLLATRMDTIDELTLMIDIGTNGEMVLGNKKLGLYSASVAAGSAFEGAHIKSGMRGTDGAIEVIKIDPETLEPSLDVIGQQTPLGICGSGIIDVVAEMLRAKILTRSGNFNKKRFQKYPHKRIRKGPDGYEYIIHSSELPGTFIKPLLDDQALAKNNLEIIITQDDIREIQKGKGAFLSAATLLMKKMNIKHEEIDQLLIAGAFGTYIHKENAHFIGLIPDIPLDQVYQIGNAAGKGAQLVLINSDLREVAEKLAKNVVYFETANDSSFSKTFAESMVFPHMKLDAFPSLKAEYKDIPYR